MNISIDFVKVNSSLQLKNIIKKSIIISSLILNLSPLLLKDLINNNAKILLASAGFLFSLSSLKLPSTEYEDKLLKTYKDSSIKKHKLILTGEIGKINSEIEIKNQIELANSIEKLPDYQIPYFASKYGVTSLISNNYISQNQSIKNDEISEINVNKSIFINKIEHHEIESNSNLNWIKKAIDSSCFIAGKKRSGKTFFMKFLLSAYIEKSRDIDLFYISDPHYDMNFDDPWINPEIDKKLIENKRLVKTQNDTLSMINDVINCGENRKKLGLTIKKNVGLIRLFLDEIDSYSSDIQSEISQAIRKIEYEFAKYGINCVVGCHSIKKGENGLDSSIISSMMNILFPSIILDRNSILSGIFPSIPKIKNMIDRYKNESLPKDGRIVAIADDSEFLISHIPKLDLIPIKINEDETISNDDNPIDKIKKWCNLCYEKFNRYPSKELLKKAWLDYTGKDLSDNALSLLIEKLNIKID
jgi:hypothetical protein